MTEGIRVVKMSGAGNDFLLLGPEEASRLPEDPRDWIRRVCRRGVSVGADGVLLVERSAADRIRVRFYNPDGSAAFCGNGSRCAARFARLEGLAGSPMVLETVAGEVPAEVEGGTVRLVLPPPRDAGPVTLEVGSDRLRGRSIVAGVPHVVIFVPSPADAPLGRWGPAVRNDPRFAPEGTNVDLVRHEPEASIDLRTWERGVERETLACGSGAVAAAYAARLAGGPARFRVVPASGIPLQVAFSGPVDDARSAELVGDARVVFEGRLGPEATAGFAGG